MSFREGALIAGMGLPGCGKSSVFRELAKRRSVEVFCEAEENEWPAAVHDREECGHFTAITWFRADRIPKLYKAAHLRNSGEVVLVDSYYDKLWIHYFDKPGMEWLLSPDDPHYQTAKLMAERDLILLPDANIVVYFHIDKPSWEHFLKQRGRKLDGHPGLIASFDTQHHFEEAVHQYCQSSGATPVRLDQQISSVKAAAEELDAILTEKGIFVA